MAEIVGVVSGGVGIVAFGLQVKQTIDALQNTKKFNKDRAPAELDSLFRRLEIVKQTLDRLGARDADRYPHIASIIGECVRLYQDVIRVVEELPGRVPAQDASKAETLKSVRRIFSTKLRDDIKLADGKVASIFQLLTL